MNRSPVLRRAACALFVLLTGGTATAEPDPDLIAYEPFDYSPEKRVLESSFFAGGQGWQAESWNWTMTKDYRYAIPEGLTYPGLQTAGGAAQQEGENLVQHVRYFLVPAPETAVRYLSYLFRLDETGKSNFAGGIVIAGDLLNGCHVRTGGSPSVRTPGVFTLQDGVGGTFYPSQIRPQTGRTHLVVLKCETMPGKDRFSLYVDPVPGEPEPGVPAKVMTDPDAGRLNRIKLTTEMHHVFDEIRVGKTWASVTPKVVTATGTGVPVLTDNFMARSDAPPAALAGHGGCSGPWTTPWVSHKKEQVFGLDLIAGPGGPVVTGPANRESLRVARSFTPPLPEAGEAWLSFSMLASGSNFAPWNSPIKKYGGITLHGPDNERFCVGMDALLKDGAPARVEREVWRIHDVMRLRTPKSVPNAQEIKRQAVVDTDIPSTIRRTAVVKLELAPGAGGTARLWLHPQGVGLVDVRRPPDAVLGGLTLTGVDTIRLGGTSCGSYGTLRIGPAAADVDTLPPAPAVFDFNATDDFAGPPGALQGVNTGQGWTAPWGRTPANQNTPSVFQMMVSPEGALCAETPSINTASHRAMLEKLPSDADEKQLVACGATTFRSLPAVFPDKGSVLLTFEALLDGDLDTLTVGLMAGSCLAASITRDRRADDKNWVLLDPVYRLRPWQDAGNTGASGRVATGDGPAGWHTVAVRFNLGPENTGTTSLWTREGRGLVDTAAPPRGTLTGCRFRGVDALMLSVGGTAQFDNLSIRTLP